MCYLAILSRDSFVVRGARENEMKLQNTFKASVKLRIDEEDSDWRQTVDRQEWRRKGRKGGRKNPATWPVCVSTDMIPQRTYQKEKDSWIHWVNIYLPKFTQLLSQNTKALPFYMKAIYYMNFFCRQCLYIWICFTWSQFSTIFHSQSKKKVRTKRVRVGVRASAPSQTNM